MNTSPSTLSTEFFAEFSHCSGYREFVCAAAYAFLVWRGVRRGSFLYAGGAAAVGIVVAGFIITMYLKAPSVLNMDMLTA